MKKYDSYKDSGIEWIGDIPEHWKKSRYRYFYFSNMGVTLLKEDVKEDGKYPVYSATETDVFFGYVEEAAVILNEGDIVIPARGNSIGHIKVVTSPSTSTQTTIYSKKISQNIETNFVKYFLQGLRENLFQFDRTAIPQITVNQVKNNLLVIPTPLEQTSIASFLDRKTSEIDDIIADKKRLLELYEEEKTAIINQAVTKGLDSNAPMKDSGIEWLGEIPEHWEVKRLKYVAFFQRGHDLSSSNFVDGDIPVFGSNGIIGYHNEYTGLGPSLIVGRSGSVGEVNFVKEPMFWAHNTSLFLLKNYGNDIQFLFFMLKRLDLKSYAAGTAVGSLNRNNIHEIKVVMPHLNEQRAIVHHIETECNKIDTKLSRTEKLIELLTEYRTALISEVVTGKIKVIENCENNKDASLYYQDQ